jgi:hypothetical protein
MAFASPVVEDPASGGVMDEGIQSKREYYTERRQRNEYPSALRSAIDNLIEEGKAKIKARKDGNPSHSSTEEKPNRGSANDKDAITNLRRLWTTAPHTAALCVS